MKKAMLCAVALSAMGSLSPALGRGQHHDVVPGLQNIVTFDTMYAVDGPLLGEANAIRGVVGDEAPWVIDHFIKGRLDKSGRLQIVVRGLVFADDPLVPPDLVGRNDEEEFRGRVSCLTENEVEGIVTANVTTKGFPADESGNSFIDDHLDLPNPCIAPIVFVMAGSEDKWFAVTGFESEDEEATSHQRAH